MDPESLPEPYCYSRGDTDGDFAHFGLWPGDGAPLSLGDAQARLFQTLADLLPPPPARLLMVGCGIGRTAHRLALLGYEVTAIASSPGLIKEARTLHAGSPVRFEALGYHDKDDSALGPGSYDIVWLQDAVSNLGTPEKLAARASGLLKDGGVLLLADEVSYHRNRRRGPPRPSLPIWWPRSMRTVAACWTANP